MVGAAEVTSMELGAVLQHQPWPPRPRPLLAGPPHLHLLLIRLPLQLLPLCGHAVQDAALRGPGEGWGWPWPWRGVYEVYSASNQMW